jgi:HAD superfamily hydrolase (TIGR01484 family)
MPIASKFYAQRARKKVLFLSDLDGTWLSKSPQHRAKLDKEIFEVKDEYAQKGVDLKFGYITARPPQRVGQEHLPKPDWTVTYNGAQINIGDAGNFDQEGRFNEIERSTRWEHANRNTGFSNDKAYDALHGLLAEDDFSNLSFKTVGEVVGNPAADANPYTSSLCFEQTSIELSPEEAKDLNANDIPDIFEAETFQAPKQIQELAKRLDARLSEGEVGHQVSPPYLFHGKQYVMFDVASPLANKGDAVTFLQREEGVIPEHTIVAGDGGNDITMMTGTGGVDEGRRSIIVGGDLGLTSAAGELKNAIIQPPRLDSALGVISGLRKHLDAIVAE